MSAASMPMYDLPEIRGALDALWAGLFRYLLLEGISEPPQKLLHDRPVNDLWNDPDIFVSQCCGYDIVNRYAGKVRPLATPHYGAPECKRGHYASVVVVAEDCKETDVLDMRGAVCVINGPESHSGMSALRALVAPVSQEGRFFSQVKVSGSHAGSLEMIKRGEADVGAIDCVTYSLFQLHRPQSLAGLRKLGRTYRAPGVPYITRWTNDDDVLARMRSAIFRTFADPDLASARQALLLTGVELLPVSAYARIVAFQYQAARYGYSKLN